MRILIPQGADGKMQEQNIKRLTMLNASLKHLNTAKKLEQTIQKMRMS